MDPLTAFGLTCNVIQVLSFGHEALSLCRRVCRDGSPEPNLSHNSAHLQRLSKKLLESINAVQASNQLSREQEDLRSIASKLVDVTTQLSKLLDELTIDGAHRRRSAIANTIKYLLLYKRKIQPLEKAMVSFQNTLDSGTLAHLWYASLSTSHYKKAQCCKFNISIHIKNSLQDATQIFLVMRSIVYSILDAGVLIQKLFLLTHIQTEANSLQALPAKQAPCNPAKAFQSLIRAFSTSSNNMHKGIKLSPPLSQEGPSQSKSMSRPNLRRLEVN